MNNDYGIRGISAEGGNSSIAQILRLMDMLQQSHNQSLGIDGLNDLNQMTVTSEVTRYLKMREAGNINR
ncbi:MAG: hypothetical protein AB9903_24385 [Vulcanimicrobiota bacterium]